MTDDFATMVHRRSVDRFAVGLLAAVVVAGLALWSALPEQMAIHWGASGNPDNHVPKPLAVLGLPAFGAATIAFTRLAPDSLKTNPGGENLAVLFVAGVFAFLQGVVYAWNLGYRFDVTLVVAPIVLGAAVLVVVSTWR